MGIDSSSKSNDTDLYGSMSSLLVDVGDYLRGLKEIGCRGFQCSDETLSRLAALGKRRSGPESLDQILRELADCRRCALCEKRNHIVFGEGSASARLVFVGEGPGKEEDKTGRPFVGAAGRLLTRIIEAMHLARDDVFICNIVKCRPPGNRTPKPEEISVCLSFLKRQLEAIKPDFVCALGAVAAQTLLETEDPISRLRGRFHSVSDFLVMPTYHPSYLLRNPEKKRDVWEDMKTLMREMDRRRKQENAFDGSTALQAYSSTRRPSSDVRER
ncbi:MAG: uracil-DNA glycosylase [Desulfobacterales bacterium]